MKETQPKNGRFSFWWPRVLFFLGVLLLATFSARAESFGDISVQPQALVSGDTQHGYREFRFLVENRSERNEHVITIIFPENSYGYGNAISRLSRTISLGPAAKAAVPFWQPPLPVQGNGVFRILVDDEDVGTISMPSMSGHMTRSGPRYGGAVPVPTFLVSRSFNFDEVNNALNQTPASTSQNFSPQAATGTADATGRRGLNPAAWSPDPRYGGPHWLELDYGSPIAADTMRIHATMRLYPGTRVTLLGTSGTNLAQLTIPPPMRSAGRPSFGEREMKFPLTSEPIKTVRLDFNSQPASSISIDAVEVSGPAGHAWATDARASSANTNGVYTSSMSPGGSPTAQVDSLRAEVSVADWSEHWLSYTPFDAVIIGSGDLMTMPPGVVEALWRYAGAGGMLVVAGSANVPEMWRACPQVPLDGGVRCQTGFGNTIFLATANWPGLNAATIKTILQEANDAARLWQSLPDEGSANSIFPVVENFKIPVRSTVFIMLVFVILIGPVNLIVLSRLGKRTWLLWTIPAISFATCIVVFAYSMLREGVTPTYRLEGLTLLDQANRRALSWGMTAFYCPLTPSDGLFFSSDTEATPLVELWNYRGGTPREVDWTQTQHLQRGWVTARVPAHFFLRKSETRRERLQVETSNGQISIVNGLGAPIRSLWLADAAGRIFAAGKIDAGQKTTLTLSNEHTVAPAQAGPQALLEKMNYLSGATDASTNAAASLLPNTYVAELNESPFLENGLGAKGKSARARIHVVVYGILEPAAP